jgi:hypothetical protein
VEKDERAVACFWYLGVALVVYHLFRSKYPLELMRATPWSITTSPTHRYLSTHCWMLLFSDTALVLTLGLSGPEMGDC